MTRPKGSKNKVKQEKSVNKPKEEVNPVDKAVETVENIPRGTFCLCGHEEEKHYGSKDKWCNTPNCRCGAWKP